MTQTNGDLPATPEPATVSETPADPSVGSAAAGVPLIVGDAPAQTESAIDASAQPQGASLGTVPPATMSRVAGCTTFVSENVGVKAPPLRLTASSITDS